MTKKQILAAIQASNEVLMPYFVGYFERMLQNEDHAYWEAEELENAKFIYLSYFQDDYALSFKYLDAELDEVVEEDSLSFSEFLENEAPDLAEAYEGFIPISLFEDQLDDLQDYSGEVDALMAAHFKAAFAEIDPETTHLPVFYKEEDAMRFIDVSTGELYDYVELKSYAFRKQSPEALLGMMQEKLGILQLYLTHFVEFVFKNEDEFTWKTDHANLAKGILVTIAYDGGTILLDYLDHNGEKVEKTNARSFMQYLEEKENFVFQHLGVYFPFEIYDYINSAEISGIEPFKNTMNQWLATSIQASACIPEKLPCFIQEVFEDDYWDVRNNTRIDSEAFAAQLK